jgi:serine/threonine protein kinase
MASDEPKQQPEPARLQIGRYVVERLLAHGGMAEVFLGKALGPAGFSKRVVIKRILPDLAQDESFVKMFLNEARLAALLEHPNIVQVFDFGEYSKTYYIAMEYVEGESLRTILKYYMARVRPTPLTPMLAWVQNVCEGLAYAHSLKDDTGKNRNIVHRDITPENILISKAGTAKVVDFGVAKAAHNPHLTTAGKIRGKPAYIAPEQIRGEQVDRRADVYSLGVTLYEALAGGYPFAGTNQFELLFSILNKNLPALHEIRPEVDSALSALVSRAIARDPKQRYPDMHALGSEIDDYLNSHGLRVKSSELAAIVAQVKQWVSSPADRSSNSPSPGPLIQAGSMGQEAQPARMVEANPRREEMAELEVAPAAAGSAPRGRSIALGALLGASVAIGVSIMATRQTARSADPLAHPAPPFGAGVAPPVAQPTASAVESSAPAILLIPGKAEVPAALDPPPAPLDSPSKAHRRHRAQRTAISPAVKPAPPRSVAVVRPAARPKQTGVAKTERPESREVPSPEPAAVGSPPVMAAVRTPGLLRASTEVGWLNLRTEPWCEVYHRTGLVGTTPINRLVFPAGRHSLRLVNKPAGIEKDIVVDVRPGEESTVRLRLSGR